MQDLYIYVRLKRVKTRSWITYKLTIGLPNLYQIKKLMARKMPGWEVVEAYTITGVKNEE